MRKLSLAAGLFVVSLPACGEDPAALEWVESSRHPIIYGDQPGDSMGDAVAALRYHFELRDGPVTISGTSSFCSGTLIGPRVLLTAAHCLRPELNETDGSIFFGEDLDAPEDGQIIGVAHVLAHPEYDSSTETHDIALIELADAPVGIEPVPMLPPALGLSSQDDGRSVRLLGYGLTEGPYLHGDPIQMRHILEVSAPIVGVCNQAGECVNGLSDNRFAFDHAGGGTCSGDSGGPAMIERGGTTYVCGVHSTIQADPWSEQPELPDCMNAAYGFEIVVDAYASFVSDFATSRGLELASPCGGGCDAIATCQAASFTCACPRGYDDVRGDASECVDIDECAAARCDANAICTNQPGSYRCECASGYEGDGAVCADIDECATATHDCSDDETCENVIGTFNCVRPDQVPPDTAPEPEPAVDPEPESEPESVPDACGDDCVMEGVSCRATPGGGLAVVLIAVFGCRRRRQATVSASTKRAGGALRLS